MIVGFRVPVAGVRNRKNDFLSIRPLGPEARLPQIREPFACYLTVSGSESGPLPVEQVTRDLTPRVLELFAAKIIKLVRKMHPKIDLVHVQRQHVYADVPVSTEYLSNTLCELRNSFDQFGRKDTDRRFRLAVAELARRIVNAAGYLGAIYVQTRVVEELEKMQAAQARTPPSDRETALLSEASSPNFGRNGIS